MTDIRDELFHNCALTAYVEVWQATGQWPPDSEQVRRLTYKLYEAELAEKNRKPTTQTA